MRIVFLASFAVAVFACGSPPPQAPAPTGDTMSAVIAPSAAPTAVGPPAPAPRCRLTVTDTQGCGTSDVEKLIAPVRTRIENCRSSSGGKLRIRARKAPGGKLAFDVEAGSTLNPTEKQCVLEALGTLHEEDAPGAFTGTGGIPPSGFTSLITVEW